MYEKAGECDEEQENAEATAAGLHTSSDADDLPVADPALLLDTQPADVSAVDSGTFPRCLCCYVRKSLLKTPFNMCHI